jgi:hypothetical protein
MISVANLFILILVGGAAVLGVSALVQKRTARRRRDAQSQTNAAS